MRRSEKQIKDIEEIEGILRSAQLCHLSLVDDGKPYVVPMNFGYAEGALYFHSAPEGRKIDIIRKNPEVCFNIIGRYDLVTGESACSWTAQFDSVTGTGKAEILIDRAGKEKGLAVLMGQYSREKYDFSVEDLDGVVVIKVQIESLSGKRSV
ncbi:MAG: pyridoxamine 5'-phosphate oxidase family protein [bacterium]|nr:MAG: pyridoxamine 5'-phosphate oxidase family protein [bacterium]